MDFGKLGQNEKLAAIGSVAAILGPIVATFGYGFGANSLTLILALAMLAVVFLPQLSPDTKLPGSKGSFMVIIGGIAALSAALALLYLFGRFGDPVYLLGSLVGIGGGLLMGWAGWQEFQSEGGKLQIGTSGSPAAGGSSGATVTRVDTPAAPASVSSAADSAQATVESAAATAADAVDDVRPEA